MTKYKFIKNYKFIIIIIIIIVIFYTIIAYYKKNIIDYYDNVNKYTAIIIEPRSHKALELVLTNFLENLSDEWNIIIMHGNNNISYIDNIINNNLTQYKNRIKMINLNIDNLSIKEYNNLLLSESLYEKIPTEIFLIFQTDSIICESNKDDINNFLEYDYVGAPWIGNQEVGNGGLSLRRKSKMIEKIKKCKYSGNAEDLFFSDNNCYPLNKPSIDEAKNFSIETIYNDKSFGVHKPWLYLKDDIDNLKKNCKNLDKLIEFNK
jgi:hypothetical protein